VSELDSKVTESWLSRLQGAGFQGYSGLDIMAIQGVGYYVYEELDIMVTESWLSRLKRSWISRL
jgi:hypothetical protein